MSNSNVAIFMPTNLKNDEPTLEEMNLDQLADEWRTAKRLEQQANASRIQIERAIQARMGEKEEGIISEKTDHHKIKIAYKLNRSIDSQAWEKVRDEIPENRRPVTIVEQLKLDKKGLTWLAENDRENYLKVSKALIVKSAKPSVAVEVL